MSYAIGTHMSLHEQMEFKNIAAAKRILHYLKETKTLGLTFKHNVNPIPLDLLIA